LETILADRPTGLAGSISLERISLILLQELQDRSTLFPVSEIMPNGAWLAGLISHERMPVELLLREGRSGKDEFGTG
jgi:hypothetical protein